MPLRQEIKDDINANSTNSNSDIASFSRRTNAQAYTDSKTRDKTEDIYYRFKEAKKTKGISDTDFKYIVKATGSEAAAQRAVIGAPVSILRQMIATQKAKENPVTPTPPKTPTTPTVPKSPTILPADLPEIIKPSQLDTNRITDTGTGGLSAFQAAKYAKHISGLDYNYLISYFKGDEVKAQKAVINLKEDELREMIEEQKGLAGCVRSQLNGSEKSGNHTLNALPGDNELEEPYHTETDFNPFDGGTLILPGVGANFVPGAGISGDVDLYFDSEGNVAIMDSIAADLGIPAFAAGGRIGYSTANNYKDVIGEFAHIGGSYGPLGAEISGSISDGKIKNLTLIGQYSPLSANVLAGEGHVGYGGTEPLWEGTREEFFEMLGKEKIKGFAEIVGQGMKRAWEWYADLWKNYEGGHS